MLVRLEYVTGLSYNAQGFAFKDVRIPEINLEESGAREMGWMPEGWVRVDGPVPEHWNLRIVRWTSTGVSVDPLPVGADGTASFALDPRATRSTLVIAPAAPRTLLSANY